MKYLLFLLSLPCFGQLISLPGGFVPHAGGLTLTPGWTFVQVAVSQQCSATATSCTFDNCATGATCIIPTTAGSVWMVAAQTGDNVTISSVTGGGGTWSLCPSSHCHAYNSSLGYNFDSVYNLSGTTGTNSITVTLSGAATDYFYLTFVELLPPAGYTATFDDGESSSSTTCTTCTAVPLTLTGTDAVVQMNSASGDPIGFNTWSNPYTTDSQGDGIALNVTSGAAPTFTQTGGTGAVFTAIAFKSSAGTFTPGLPALFSIVQENVSWGSSGIPCSPTCTYTVTSTGAGHLLFLGVVTATTPGYISSVTGGGTWVVPAGCEALGEASIKISCAYVLSSSSGTTSLSITMNTVTASTDFSFWEISRSSGSFVLDAVAATNNASGTNFPTGQALTLTGTNDIIFQMIGNSGGVTGASLYPLTYSGPTITNCLLDTNYTASLCGLVGTVNGSAPIWPHPSESGATGVFGIAFK